MLSWIIFINDRIRGSFHDNFTGFSGFGFPTKLARTKNQLGTQKKRTSITGVNCFTGIWYCLGENQQEWCQLLLMVYFIHQNLRQLLFSPPPLPEYAATIFYCVSVTPGETPLPPPPPPPPILHLIQFLCWTLIRGIWRWCRCLEPTITVPLGVGHCCKFLIQSSHKLLPTSDLSHMSPYLILAPRSIPPPVPP